MQRDRLEVLDIRVARGPGDDYSVVLRLGEREFPAGRLAAAIVTAVAEASPADRGARLFAAFTADEPVRLAWNLAAALAPRRRIRLRIADDAPALHALPWEALHDASPDATAREPAADRDTPFSRLVRSASEPPPAVDAGPLRVLSAVAAPLDLEAYGLPPLDRAAEQVIVAEALAAAPPGAALHTALAGPCTLAALEAALEQGPHVLHLVAHGAARRDGEVSLFLEAADGGVDRIDGARFAAMLEGLERSLRLVVLMVCEGASRSPGDSAAGLAPRVLAAGVPAVLAMPERMPIATGRAFTRAFYDQLWTSGEVDRAANRARATLRTGRLPGAVPVLYSALAGNRLFTPRPTATPPAPAPAPALAPNRWGPWSALAGRWRHVLAARGRDRCVDLLAISADDVLHACRQQAPGGPLGPWEPLRPATRDARVTLDQRGRLCVFAVDRGGACSLRVRTGPGAWGEWQELGGHAIQMTAACGVEGCLSLYIVDDQGVMRSREQNDAGGSWYRWEDDWQDGDEEHLQILAVRDGRGLVELFTLHADHMLWSSRQDVEAEFSDWKLQGGKFHAFDALLGDDGRLQLLALTGDGGLHYRRQKTPGGGWGGWQKLGGEHTAVFAAQRTHGELEVLALTSAGELHTIVRTGDSFGPWRSVAAPPLTQLVAVESADTSLELFALDRGGALHRTAAHGRPTG